MIDIERYLEIQLDYDKKNGRTMEFLSKKYNVSRQRIQQIISTDLQKYLIRKIIKILIKELDLRSREEIRKIIEGMEE